jgi:threonine aldolase
MIFCNLAETVPATAFQVAERLKAHGVKPGIAGKRRFRLVTHYWIDDAAIATAIRAFQEVLRPDAF